MVARKPHSGKSKSHSDGGGNGSIKDIEIEIVKRTNVEDFYKNTLGFTIKGSRPNAQGWLSVLSKDDSGADEKKPSAAINVGNSELRGKYTTRNDNEQALSIFEAGARFGSLGDWRAVRAHLAERAGVPLPPWAAGTDGKGKRRQSKPRGDTPHPEANGKGECVRGASVGASANGRPPPTPPPSVAAARWRRRGPEVRRQVARLVRLHAGRRPPPRQS
jgi:hypothetical protein